MKMKTIDELREAYEEEVENIVSEGIDDIVEKVLNLDDSYTFAQYQDGIIDRIINEINRWRIPRNKKYILVSKGE